MKFLHSNFVSRQLTDSEAYLSRLEDLKAIRRFSVSTIDSDKKLEITLQALADNLESMRSGLGPEERDMHRWLSEAIDDVLDIFEWKFGDLDTLYEAAQKAVEAPRHVSFENSPMEKALPSPPFPDFPERDLANAQGVHYPSLRETDL